MPWSGTTLRINKRASALNESAGENMDKVWKSMRRKTPPSGTSPKDIKGLKWKGILSFIRKTGKFNNELTLTAEQKTGGSVKTGGFRREKRPSMLTC